MSAGPDPTPEAMRRTTDDVTCLACGCLCDDLSVTVEGREVVEVRNGCELGSLYFRSLGRSEPRPAAAVEGRPVEVAEAVRRAAGVLAGARAPVVFGLAGTGNEAVAAALALAETVGARVVLDRTAADLGRVAAFQAVGRVSATLGEVKGRADVVVYWGADPVRTHPRHLECYSAAPAGRFVPEGRAGRTIVVVDSERTATAEVADVFITIPADRDVAALTALRMILKGKATRSEGLDLGPLEKLAAVLREARYGAMFFQGRARAGDRSGADWVAASRLVRDLNDAGRFVLLGMGGPMNLAGAEAVLTWQGGFLQGVDYRTGVPRPLDEAPTLDEILRTREPDAILALNFGLGFPVDELSPEALEHLRAIPRVVIGPGATSVPPEGLDVGPLPTVALATAVAGFDAGGTVVRVDGIALPLRPVTNRTQLTDLESVQAIMRDFRQARTDAS